MLRCNILDYFNFKIFKIIYYIIKYYFMYKTSLLVIIYFFCANDYLDIYKLVD